MVVVSEKLGDVIHDLVVMLCTDVYVHTTEANVSSQGSTVRVITSLIPRLSHTCDNNMTCNSETGRGGPSHSKSWHQSSNYENK